MINTVNVKYQRKSDSGAQNGPADPNLAISDFCYEILSCKPVCVEPSTGNGTTSSLWCQKLQNTEQFNNILSNIAEKSAAFSGLNFETAKEVLCGDSNLEKELLATYLNIYSNQLFSFYELDQLCCNEESHDDHEEDHGESHGKKRDDGDGTESSHDDNTESSHRARISCSLLNSNSTIQSLIDEAEAALVQSLPETQNIASALATINSATAPGSGTCPSICNPPVPSYQTGQQPAGTGDDDEEESSGDEKESNDDDYVEEHDYHPKKFTVKFNFKTSNLEKFYEKLKSLLQNVGPEYEISILIGSKRAVQATGSDITGIAEIGATDEESAIAAAKAVQRTNDTYISSCIYQESISAVNENGEVFINNEKPYITPIEKASFGGIVIGLLIVVVGSISLLFVYKHTYTNKVDFHGASAASRNPDV